jgi:hypothetical protein
MPILVAGIVIGIALCLLYRTQTGSPGVRLFDNGETYIVIDGSSVRVRRGFVPERTMAALADVLRRAGVSNGHITLSRDNRTAPNHSQRPVARARRGDVCSGRRRDAFTLDRIGGLRMIPPAQARRGAGKDCARARNNGANLGIGGI